MGTLAKVAIGVAVAKGVSSMMGKKASGSAGSGGTFGGTHSPGRTQGGGLEDMMGEVLGGRATRRIKAAACSADRAALAAPAGAWAIF